MRNDESSMVKLARALQAREGIRGAETDALRIVDGEGDGFDDLTIDDLAGRWVAETRGDRMPEWLKEAKEPQSIYWKRLGKKESPVWIAGEEVKEPFVIRENGVRSWIDFAAGYSQGIFLDQRENRLALRQMAKGKKVLNCFAYTCAFGVCAALGGAETVNVDLSKRYLEWGKRNYELNGIDVGVGGREGDHDFIYGDVFDWLKRFKKKGRIFDIVLLDPPTFSRNEKGVIFTVEAGFGPLVRAAEEVVSGDGVIFCSTNQRSLSAGDFRRLVMGELMNPRDWMGEEGRMPGDFSGEDYLKSWWLRRG